MKAYNITKLVAELLQCSLCCILSFCACHLYWCTFAVCL